jgi:outer membrane lipoprotein-sorting protein
LLAVFAVPAFAQTRLTLEQVLTPLTRSPPVRAPFVEERHFTLLSEPVIVRGELIFAPPDRLEKRVTSPEPETLVVDGEEMTIESARSGSRRVNIRLYPVVSALMSGLRATLTGNGARLREVFFISVEGTEQEWTLTLRPRSQQLSEMVDLVRISGTHNLVNRTEIVDKNGDRTVTRLLRGQ